MKLGRVNSILLIEDDPDDQELFELALLEVTDSVELIKAMDGIDALKKLADKDYRPDVIVLDINMPRMNGHEFLIALKKQHALKEIPVVLYSTTPESSYVNKIMEAGAHSFFKKPDNFQALCIEVQSITSHN